VTFFQNVMPAVTLLRPDVTLFGRHVTLFRRRVTLPVTPRMDNRHHRYMREVTS
jgi:hypothetical protein